MRVRRGLRRVLGAGLAAIPLLLAACGSAGTCPTVEKSTYLKNLAAGHGLSIGTLYNYSYSRDGYDDAARYNQTIANEFQTISLEFEFAMDEIWSAPDEYVYTYLDYALAFADENDLRVKGTHLVWHAQTPEWLEEGFDDGTFSAAAVRTMTQDYITALFAHISSTYPGVMESVNVVNEVIRDDFDTDATYGEFRNTIWREALGAAFVEELFGWADAAVGDADMRLVINDYGIELSGPKKDRFDTLLDALDAASAPVDAVGLQCHFSVHDLIEDPFDKDDFRTVLQSYADRGLKIELTELDVRINDDCTGLTDAKLQEQSDLFESVVSAALSNSSVVGIHFWGFNDDLSYLNGDADWLPHRRDWGLLFDACYQPKPAYFGVTAALE